MSDRSTVNLQRPAAHRWTGMQSAFSQRSGKASTSLLNFFRTKSISSSISHLAFCCPVWTPGPGGKSDQGNSRIKGLSDFKVVVRLKCQKFAQKSKVSELKQRAFQMDWNRPQIPENHYISQLDSNTIWLLIHYGPVVLPSEEFEVTANSPSAHIETHGKLILRTLSYLTVNSQDELTL